MKAALLSLLLVAATCLASCAITLPYIDFLPEHESASENQSANGSEAETTVQKTPEQEAEGTAYNLSDVMRIQTPVNTTCYDDGACGTARHIQFDLKISPSVADGFKKAGYTLTFGLVSAKSSDIVSGVSDLAVSVSDDGKITYIGSASSCNFTTVQWGSGSVAWTETVQTGTFCGMLLDVLPDSGDTVRQVVKFAANLNPQWMCRGFVVAYKEGSKPVLMYTQAVTHQYQKEGILV